MKKGVDHKGLIEIGMAGRMKVNIKILERKEITAIEQKELRNRYFENGETETILVLEIMTEGNKFVLNVNFVN